MISLLAQANSFWINRPICFEICVCLFSLSIVNGEPTVTVRPNADEKFQRNKQAGEGAYIPATIKVEEPREYDWRCRAR